MDFAEALDEFAGLLFVGSTALSKLIQNRNSEAPLGDVAEYIAEVEQIAHRLEDIGKKVSELAARG